MAAGEGSGPPRRHWYDGFHPPLSPEERARALADPGPTWKQYFFHDFLRWWGVLGFFVADALIVASFLQPLLLWVMLPALAGALYLEFLAYAYLWHRPDPERDSRHGPFSPSWTHPVPFGRWTPEADRHRRGLDLPVAEGPDPREFL